MLQQFYFGVYFQRIELSIKIYALLFHCNIIYPDETYGNNWSINHCLNTSDCCVQSLSRVWFFAIPWIVAHQASLLMEFSRLNTGAGCCFLHQEIFLTQKWKHKFLACPSLAGTFFTTKPPGEPHFVNGFFKNVAYIGILLLFSHLIMSKFLCP